MSTRMTLVGCLSLIMVAGATAQDTSPARKYTLTLDSEVLAAPEKGKGATLKTSTRFDYTFKPVGPGKIESSVDAIELSIGIDGRPTNVTKLSRDGLTSPDGQGGTRSVTYASAPPQARELLDQFGKTLAIHTIGPDGGETAEPEMKITSGILFEVSAQATIRFVHARFPESEKSWVAKTKLPLGQGQFATGELKFEKVGTPSADGSIRVKVTGSLRPTGKLGNAVIKDGLYEITGLQIYSPKLRDWTSGAYDMNVRVDAEDPVQGKVSTSGTMKLVLKTRP